MGQSILVEAYERSLHRHGRHAAQVLLTAEDLEHRTRYLNARNTLLTLLELGAVPIINENDTVAVEELQTTFGDNDRLAAIVTNLIRAPLLVLLSDVEGLFDGDPRRADSHVIPTIEQLDDSVLALVRDAAERPEQRRHGQQAGSRAAGHHRRRERDYRRRAASPDVLPRILAGETVGTLLLAQGQTVAARKRWIGLTVQPRGRLVLDAGAKRPSSCQGRSLLATGVVDVEGQLPERGRRRPPRPRRRRVRPRTDQLQRRRPPPHPGTENGANRRDPGPLPLR